ncbi:sensor histidine kinase [Marinobacterium aestuariivivens]|uniref:histidine kinase n=1 Tax=Marinobacterium aestuariivivens TaxID=1698799 RepID=A0ABW1ZXL9_9GAMM
MRRLQFLLTRSVWLLSATALLLLFVSLGLLIYGAWRDVERIPPLERHLNYVVAIELAAGEVRTRLLNLLQADSAYLDPDGFDDLREQLRGLSDSDAYRMATTPEVIDNALTLLVQFDGRSRVPLDGASSALRGALNQELLAHQLLVADFHAEARRKLVIVSALALCLLVISALLWTLVRQRVLRPLNKLIDQMSLLARRDFSELSVDDTDAMLHPMIEKYNAMAQRLRTLEQAQQQRHANLTREVRNSTAMLLQQQRRLAQAERLGAVGEVAAGVAHELRNPLTSVQMALENLHHDVPDAELAERVDLINDEVKRATRQLNQLLDQARQRPEKAFPLDIGEEVESLVTLAGFQLHEDVTLSSDVADGLRCRLPRSQFRQMLLNLLLNAGQALQDAAGQIQLQVRRRGGMLEIEVRDSGPGFSAQMLETGIQPFRSWRAGGTGLGLAMVHRFTHDLGGELQLSNRQEGGACVTLRLPYRDTDD